MKRSRTPVAHRLAALLSPLAVLVLTASPSFANLLENGDFETNTLGWTCTGDGSSAWSTLDLDASGSSGSIETVATAPANNRFIVCTQCVNLDASSEYRLSLWTYWPNIERGSAVGTTRMSLGFHPEADCLGGALYSDPTIFTPPFNSWTAQATPWIPRVTDSLSATVQFLTWANDIGASVTANYDEILLQGDRIFASDFEDGASDLCDWSSTVPETPC